MENLINKFAIYPLVNYGNPTIRNMRFSVSKILELLAEGSSDNEISNE